jgi:hypothetical protein
MPMPMRKLLQNKTVVASLVVVAGLCLAGNFVRWPQAPFVLVAARPAPDALAVDPALYPVRNLLLVEGRLDDWRDQDLAAAVARDPFARPRTVRPTNDKTTAGELAPPPPVFQVHAISIDADKAFAVVNRQVLAVGEQIEGYVLEQIQSMTIRLRGPAGTIEVPIGPRPGARREQKAASAK